MSLLTQRATAFHLYLYFAELSCCLAGHPVKIILKNVVKFQDLNFTDFKEHTQNQASKH